jgi:hypothetical protein
MKLIDADNYRRARLERVRVSELERDQDYIPLITWNRRWRRHRCPTTVPKRGLLLRLDMAVQVA